MSQFDNKLFAILEEAANLDPEENRVWYCLDINCNETADDGIIKEIIGKNPFFTEFCLIERIRTVGFTYSQKRDRDIAYDKVDRQRHLIRNLKSIETYHYPRNDNEED